MIDQWQEKAGIASLCRVLDVSRSGFYAARQRRHATPSLCTDSVRVKAVFAASSGSYGSRRVCKALHDQGLMLGRYRVRGLMRQHRLRACWKRNFHATTNSAHALPVADNVLNRQFRPEAANRAWAADITYIRTRSGWLYLAAVIDLFSRKIVGWAMAPSMPAELVCTALQRAIAARQPKPGLVMHSDRGSQYASEAHRALLAKHGLIASMSRKGNCWDNAVMERFFLNLKMERVWQRSYANHSQATTDITDYLVNFYNPIRLHSTLGYRSPNDYEKAIT